MGQAFCDGIASLAVICSYHHYFLSQTYELFKRSLPGRAHAVGSCKRV